MARCRIERPSNSLVILGLLGIWSHLPTLDIWPLLEHSLTGASYHSPNPECAYVDDMPHGPKGRYLVALGRSQVSTTKHPPLYSFFVQFSV